MVSQGRVQQNRPAGLPVCNSRIEGVLGRPSRHYRTLPALALSLPTGVLYAAASTDPFELLDRGVTAAARLSGETGASSAFPSLAWRGASCLRQSAGPRPEARGSCVLEVASCCPMQTPCQLGVHGLGRGAPRRVGAATLGKGGPRLAGRVWLVLLGRHVHGCGGSTSQVLGAAGWIAAREASDMGRPTAFG